MKNFIQKVSPYVISFSIVAGLCWLVISLLMPNFVAPAWCGTLSKEGCKILRDAQLATSTLGYGAFEASLTSSVDMNNGLGENTMTIFAEGEYFRVPSIRQINPEFKSLLGLNASLTLSATTEGLTA
ncbi:MAG TPA: hypothetical protein PLZ51_27960, partial [Aggregatilineales bacterium]|nr:hypothetical protein [Aggregatilineales bacterium]